MRLDLRRTVGAALGAAGFAPALAGCANPLSPTRDLRGTWAAYSFPGSNFIFTLSQQGDSLWGTGTYAGEAGPSGTLSVVGRLQAAPGDSVHLDFAVTQQLPTVQDRGTDHFAGRLTNDTTLAGATTLTSGGTAVTVAATYYRTR